MTVLRILISIVYLLSFIDDVESGSCFLSPCRRKRHAGCQRLMKNLTVTQDDCCNGGGYGFYIFTEENDGGCFECDFCTDYLGRIDGGWSEWSAWTRCDKPCGGGTRHRSRLCNNPLPSKLGKHCEDSPDEMENCNTFHCPVDGSWSKWTEWSDCSVTCGRGRKTRQRKCDNPTPKHGGKPCSGSDAGSIACFPRYCPVDGGWTSWSEWSECSKTCGSGESERSRQCTKPAPEHGGKKCPGENTEFKSCNDDPCPVHGQWGKWSHWSKCIAVDCKNLEKGGIKTRTRMCNDPAPMYGGKMCKGLFVEKGYCNENPDNCPVNGNWSDWSPWNCSCDVGVIRDRQCDNPKPRMGGKNCVGSHTETKDYESDIYMQLCFDDCKRSYTNEVTPTGETTMFPYSGSGSGNDQETEGPETNYYEYGEANYGG